MEKLTRSDVVNMAIIDHFKNTFLGKKLDSESFSKIIYLNKVAQEISYRVDVFTGKFNDKVFDLLSLYGVKLNTREDIDVWEETVVSKFIVDNNIYSINERFASGDFTGQEYYYIVLDEAL